MNRIKLSITIFCCIFFVPLYGQIGISADGSLPDKSAMLEIKSSSKGFLFPRMTTSQIRNIWQPASGLVVFNIYSADFYGFSGMAWIAFWDNSDTIRRYCPDSINYSGQWYTTVQIGTQCWMAENLNAGSQVLTPAFQSNNGNTEKYCYLNVPDSCAVYGGLYQWNEMMRYSYQEGVQGICPTGWHLPSAAEYDVLAGNLGGSGTAGGKIKETGYRHWEPPNSGATNSSGFTAYGSGTYDPIYGNGYYLIRTFTSFWTSTVNGSDAWRQDLHYVTYDLSPYSCQQIHAFSVRCIKN